MFDINPIEVGVLVLWAIGVLAALISRGASTSRTAWLLTIGVAVFVPVLGSLLAILRWTLWVAGPRKRASVQTAS